MRLPDFLGIGALKAGTTLLDSLLRQHPGLCLPRIKEVEFFTRHYDRGPDWYAARFADCQERLRGEISPQYLFDPRCPERIQGLVPDCRLLVSLRDPVDRAYSQYKHWVQETGFPGSFESFLTEHPGAVERGRYHPLLQRYLRRFPRSQLHVLLFEDLIADPAGVMNGVYAFLGLEAVVVHATGGAVNASSRPRFHAAYRATKRLTRGVRALGGGRMVEAAKRVGGRRVFGSEPEAAFPPLLPETATRLAGTYRDDVTALSAMLDRDLGAIWAHTA